ncbi:MAG: esterase-like activity of phytase family protein [Pseudomonadota bacterium]
MIKVRALLFTLCVFSLAASETSSSDLYSPRSWRTVEIDDSPHQLRGDKAPDESFAVDTLVFRGGLYLASKEESFGGYSGVTVSPDGESFLAVSDRSHWLAANLNYGPNGRLIGAENARMMDVASANGRPLTGNAADAEAVFTKGADLFVGFERKNRIDTYRSDEEGTIVFQRNLVTFDDANIPFNKGIEAIAPLDEERLIAFTERAASPNGGVKAWIISLNGDTAELSYKPADAFSPTDAALLPGGDILVLERAYSRLLGPRARLARIRANDVFPGAVLQGNELARLRPPLVIDNMEGLSLRQNDDGDALLYIISDDNQNPRRQKTILLMFELTDAID